MLLQGRGASAKLYAHARSANSARVGHRVSYNFCVFIINYNLPFFSHACPCSKCESNETDRSLITRHDSTLSAMRALLESSQEGSPSKDDSTVENSQASTEASQTDDCSSSTTISGRPSPVTPTSEMPTPTPSSQQTVTDEETGACLNHEEHAAEVIEHAHERVSLKTRRPRLWRHGYEIFQSICTYNGRLLIFYVNFCSTFYFNTCACVCACRDRQRYPSRGPGDCVVGLRRNLGGLVRWKCGLETWCGEEFAQPQAALGWATLRFCSAMRVSGKTHLLGPN